MAGRFATAKYETNEGAIHPIRVQPETITADNPEPPGGVSESLYVRVSGSKRAYGIKARYITLSRKIGTDSDYSGATVYARIPVLLASAWIAYVPGSTVTYQGVDWTVASKTVESLR